MTALRAWRKLPLTKFAEVTFGCDDSHLIECICKAMLAEDGKGTRIVTEEDPLLALPSPTKSDFDGFG